VLSLTSAQEYLVIFNEGCIYCCFHSSFEPSFQKVADRWSQGMREAGNLAHGHNFPRNFVRSGKLDKPEAQKTEERDDFSTK
jgi:hypothetical protein